MFLSGPIRFLLSLATLALVVSCSNEKADQSERTIDEPVDVAGGFGLICIPSDNPTDDSKSDFMCAVSDANGEKFVERPELKLDFSVELNGQSVPLVTLDSSDAGHFKFTVAKSDVSQVKVTTNFVNPQDGNAAVTTVEKELPETLTGWELVNVSPAIVKNNELWWSSHRGEIEWSDANNACNDLILAGVEDWRLPTRDELSSALTDKIYQVVGQHLALKSDFYWSSTSASNGYLAVSLRLGRETESNSIKKQQFVCVRSESD